MKKLIIFILVGVTAIFPSFADADLVYTYDDENHTCSVDRASNVSGEVIIPSTVERNGIEYSVTSIVSDAFYHCTSLTSVTFPEGLTEIGNYAFYNTSLTSITFPERLATIGYCAFSSCSYLESVTIPESVTYIGSSAFIRTSLSNLYFNAINAITDGAFGNVDTVILGANVKVAPSVRCKKLEFCQGIEDISKIKYADKYGTSYGELELYSIDTVINLYDLDEWAMNTPLGYSDFFKLPDFSAYNEYEIRLKMPVITFDYSKPVKNLTLSSKVEKIAPYAFAGFKDLESVTFPEYLAEIGEGAFANTKITTVNLPSSATKIGDFAFAQCYSLGEVKLPASIEKIGKGVFFRCSALYDIQLPESLCVIDDYTFRNCSDLEKFCLPANITRIGKGAFYDCTKLTVSDFPDSLEIIDEDAFNGCKSIFSKEFKFGKSLKTIGSRAFYGSSGNDSYLNIKLPEGLQSIEAYAFADCPIININLPSTLIGLGNGAFTRTAISQITIPDGITIIGDDTFKDATNLSSVNLSENLERMGKCAFENCPISKIELPESLKAIGDRAFFDTDIVNFMVPEGVEQLGSDIFNSLTYLSLGDGITTIKSAIAENVDVLEMKSPIPPQLGTDRLGFSPKIVIVPEGAGEQYLQNNRWKDYNISARNSRSAKVYISEPGTLAAECRIQTGYLPAMITNLIVEGTLNDDDFAVMRSNMTSCYAIDLSKVANTSIPQRAFMDKDILLDLTLPDVVETIGEFAFSGCSVLHLTNLPSNLKQIGDYAFKNCQSMDNDLIFPKTFESIGANAFENCYSLRSADFSLCPDTKMEGSSIFLSCRGLSNVALPRNITAIPYQMFGNTGLLSITIPSSVTVIKQSAFENTKYLSQVAFSGSLETIEYDAFNNSGIAYADLPKSLKTIASDAFANSSLVYADIKEGVNTLSSGIFKNCPMLMVVNLPSSLSEIGKDALASASLAAITCAATVPPATSGTPFSGVDNYNCALTIPKPSYSKYLGAEYWGAFVNIRNCMDVTIPELPEEVGSSADSPIQEIDVTYIDENDYQNMLEDENEEYGIPVSLRSRAIRMLQRTGVISKYNGYGRLFNGASLFAADNSRIRIFFNVPDSFEDFKVMYDGKDVTSQIDKGTMSFVTPELTTGSSLVIFGNYNASAFGGINMIYDEESAPVYSLTGSVVGYGKDFLQHLYAGIYIFCGRKIIVK